VAARKGNRLRRTELPSLNLPSTKTSEVRHAPYVGDILFCSLTAGKMSLLVTTVDNC
jgi:hypothetical protein